MIVLNLLCDNGHRFEGWFASSDAYREQRERALVQCPHCETTAVAQLPAGPHVKRSSSAEAPLPAQSKDVAQALFQALATIARSAEDVGERFPEEARRIHYDEAPARSIRGVASAEETRELLDEGIVVLPAPVVPEGEVH